MATSPIRARRSGGTSRMSAKGSNPSDRRLIRGLKMDTAIHMFRNVFGKTPGFCSSMKLAELSKPLMPNIAAAKPKNSACGMLVAVGRCQFSIKSDGS